MITKENVPISQKYCLSILEASEYFGIGEKKLRKLVNDNSEADYIVYNGSKCLIKRQKFEAFIDECFSL